ncbi:MAG: hypothetical protein US51_C0019G0003 [Microgenomates group bacterium GW2011_GWA2_37_6]|nr:MAG: hypothetical protein US51_C0019G0003 [Microgenomates group bacterium GW2011_GWA2_37_6]
MEVIKGISSFIDWRTRPAETPDAAMRRFQSVVDTYNLAKIVYEVASGMASRLEGDEELADQISDMSIDVEVLRDKVLRGPNLRREFVLYESPWFSLTFPLPEIRRHKNPDSEALQENLVYSTPEEYDTI